MTTTFPTSQEGSQYALLGIFSIQQAPQTQKTPHKPNLRQCRMMQRHYCPAEPSCFVSAKDQQSLAVKQQDLQSNVSLHKSLVTTQVLWKHPWLLHTQIRHVSLGLVLHLFTRPYWLSCMECEIWFAGSHLMLLSLHLGLTRLQPSNCCSSHSWLGSWELPTSCAYWTGAWREEECSAALSATSLSPTPHLGECEGQRYLPQNLKRNLPHVKGPE